MKYVERQKFNQWWLWLLMIGVFMVTAVPIVQEVLSNGLVWGNVGPLLVGPAVAALVMILIATLELRTTITRDGIEVKFWPLVTKRIFRSEIEGARVRTYSAIKEFGGWGYRIRPGATAINMQGNSGLEIALENGQQLMIGTQQPEALAAFMEEYLATTDADPKTITLKDIQKLKQER